MRMRLSTAKISLAGFLAVADKDLEVYFEYGAAPGLYTVRTPVSTFPARKPIEVVLDRLRPNTRYYYRMRHREPGSTPFAARDEHAFHTQRPPGAAFTFAVQADPHMDEGSNADLYKLTLRNMPPGQPDFLIDLGDIFMSDKLRPVTYEEIVKRHLLLRSFYDLVCHSLPLFLVLGNHEGEHGRRLDGTPENLPIWATRARKLYYPNPFPDGFYTGNAREEDHVGLRENYYAWQWGDALFVVLDPFWSTAPGSGRRAGAWSTTLGREQYDWLKRALETSPGQSLCHERHR